MPIGGSKKRKSLYSEEGITTFTTTEITSNNNNENDNDNDNMSNQQQSSTNNDETQRLVDHDDGAENKSMKSLGSENYTSGKEVNNNESKNNNNSGVTTDENGEEVEEIDHWRGLLMAVLVLCVQFSIFGISNSYASFSDEMKKDATLGNPSSSEVSLPNAVMNGIAPVISIFAGALTDKIGPRPILTTACLGMGLGSFLGSFAESPIALVFLYGIPAGVGMASLSSPSAVALTSWLVKKLPLGVGIAYAGSGVGSSIVVAVAGIMASNHALGWRASFRILAIFALFGFVAALFIRPRKGHKHKAKINLNANKDEFKWFLKKLFTSKAFIFLFLSAAFCSFSMFAIFYIIVPYASKFGNIDDYTPYNGYTEITVAAASTLFTYLGVARGLISLFGGALATRTEPSFVYALGNAICAVSCLAWAVATEYWHLAIICTFLGAGIGCIFASFNAMAARCFAGPHCGLAVGITNCGYSVGGFAGPPIVLAITSADSNNFTNAFVAMAWCCIIPAAIVLFILKDDIKQQWFATQAGLESSGLNDWATPKLAPGQHSPKVGDPSPTSGYQEVDFGTRSPQPEQEVTAPTRVYSDVDDVQK